MQQQEIPEDFSFPYEPYKIQKDFMKSLYKAIDSNKIGIFESPTGTGKSLSIICGALTWLMNHSNNEQKYKIDHDNSGKAHKRKRDSAGIADIDDIQDDEPEWIKEQSKVLKVQTEKERTIREQEKQERRKDRVDSYQRKRQKFLHGALSQPAAKQDQKNVNLEDDSDLLLVNYEDDDSGRSNSKTAILKNLNIGIKSSLLDDLFSSDEEDDDKESKKKKSSSIFAEDLDDDLETYETPKILYCSRTHTQLTQFVQEVQRTSFAEKIRLVSLASRKQMCQHPTVSKIQSQTRLNEVCLDMKSKKDKKHKCPYDDPNGLNLFKDHVLIKVRDIEDLNSLGKRLEACSYYGSRKAIPQAQVVTIPYNSLIHQPTRESLGIKLEECVVIIDEAHNLIDAVIHTHSFQITHLQVQQTFSQLSGYFEKYRTRLLAKNQANVKQLLNVLESLLSFLKDGIKGTSYEKNENSTDQVLSEVLSMNEFSFKTNIDNINMFQVCEFIQRSELTKKLNGFIDRRHRGAPMVKIHTRGTSDQDESIEAGVHAVTAFLLALTNVSKDGKIMIQINKTHPSKSNIRFVLLNPSVYFAEVVKKAKSVILAGGTMEPITSVVQQLFPDQKERIQIFQCGHVIPDENILPICLTSAPSSKLFDFTFRSRNEPTTMNDLGTLVTNLCNVVPDGIVLFFPSYAYEASIYNYWFKNGVVRRIESKKKFFREPKSSTEVDSVLNDYKRTIDRGHQSTDQYSFKGAVLSCVIGGKMSEGINFSDGYGRCVIVVGLPFPNNQDLELKEKMSYLDSLQRGSGDEYYEDLCMKAVNQSIGRSIRHANDYATIILVDKRYARTNIQMKLPKWISSRVQTHNEFGKAYGQVTRFFKSKK